MTFKRQPPHFTFNAGTGHKVGGIHRHITEIKFVYLHILPEKRKKSYVYSKFASIGDGVVLLWQRVVGLHYAQTLHSQIERKDKVHPLHTYVHTRLFRGV